MASCEFCRDNLLEHLYGLLDVEEAQVLERHLLQCAPCRESLEGAKRAQALLSRAAHVVREAPSFSAPGASTQETGSPASLPQTQASTTTPPATVPMTAAPRRRSALRRYWPAWAAAAAALLLLIGGQYLYQRGRQVRSQALTQSKKDLDALNARFAALEKDFAIDALKVEANLRAERIHVHAMGPTRYHPGLPAVYRVTARDVEGAPAKAQVALQIVDTAEKVLFETKKSGAGEIALTIPPGLDLMANRDRKRAEDFKLILETKAGALTERMEEGLTLAPSEHATHIALNKDTFQVGEVMFFRTLTLDRASHQPPLESIPLRFSLVNEEGAEVYGLTGQTGPGGIAAGNFALTEELSNGTYNFLVQAEEKAKEVVLAQNRIVEVFRDEALEFEFDRANYRAGEVVRMTARPRVLPRRFALETAGAKGDEEDKNALGTGYDLRITVDGKPVPARNAGAYSAEMSQRLAADALGNTMVEFQLPKDIERGDVVLELERKSGKATERFVQSVPVSPSQATVDFYPEGGDLVPGVSNKIYYRVRSATGAPLDPEKVLITSTGATVHQSESGGLGYFSIVPKGKDKYEARLIAPDLPEGKAEIADPLRNLTLAADGVVLHVPQPVATAGEAIEFVLRNPVAGPARRLLLLASCRGVVFDQQLISVKKGDNTGSLPLPHGVDGLLRLTLLHAPGEEQEGFKTAQPLAERLIFRAPKEHLTLSCAVEKGPYRPGQKVKMNIEARDEKKETASAWAMAAVVDERARSPFSESNLPAFFHVASNLSSGADLDLARIHLNADAEAATALDLFLGVHGWRRFAPQRGADMLAQLQRGKKDGEAAKSIVPLPIFSRENRPILAQRASYQTAAVQKLAETERQARRRRAELIDERERTLTLLKAAADNLALYEVRPQLTFRFALGALLLLFIAAGVLSLLAALYRYGRAQSPRPAIGFSFACLALALALLIGGRHWLPEEIQSRTNPNQLASVRMKSWPELRVDMEQEGRATKPLASPLLGPFALEARKSEEAAVAGDDYRATVPMTFVREPSPHAAKVGADHSRQPFNQLAVGKGVAAPADAARYDPVPLEPLFQNEELQDRFRVASRAQRPLLDRDGAEARTGDRKTVLPVASPSNLPLPDGSTAADNASKVDSLGLLVREYTYRAFPLRPHYQHTVSWHPALFLEKGQAEVVFDLSPDVSAYRILLLANTASGRLGSYEGRLKVGNGKK